MTHPATTLAPLHTLVGDERTSIPAVMAARVAQSPDAPFIRYRSKVWTYAAGWGEILRFAGFLQARGYAGPGQRVASFLTNCPEAVWSWLGTQATGATYVSLNREHRGEVLLDMLTRSRASVLVTEASAVSVLPALEGTAIRTVIVVDDASSAPPELPLISYREIGNAAPVDPIIPGATDIATVMFTSGTTGRSKAVPLTHNQFCRGAGYYADAIGIRATDVFHAWTPLFHIGGQMHTVLTAAVAGASAALFPSFSRSRFWSEVKEVGATLMLGFPVVAEILWGMPARPDDADNPLRLALIANPPPAFHREFEARFGVKILDPYGMTEAEMLAIHRWDEETPVGSCGRPGPDFEVAILDEDDRSLPAGQVGEIAVRPKVPDVITPGYEGDEAATLQSWRNLWFHTGDLGRFDEQGFLYFHGRLKHRIRRRGENVSALEVERIIQQHPAVAECVVLGVPAEMGEEDVKAVVAPKQGLDLVPAELHAFCRERMARFMVPRYVDVRDTIPRTDVGKPRTDLLQAVDENTWDAEAEGARPTAG